MSVLVLIGGLIDTFEAVCFTENNFRFSLAIWVFISEF